MTRRRSDTELIEIVPVDDGIGWDDQPAESYSRQRPEAPPHTDRRWMIVASLVVVATAVAVVVSDDPAEETSVTTSTTMPDPATPSGPVRSSSSAGPLATRGVLLDAPGWTLVAASSLGLTGDRGAVTRTWRDGDADGRVVMVESVPTDGEGPSGLDPVIDAVPVTVDGVRLATRRSGDITSARLRVGRFDVRVEAKGVPVDQLATFVASATVIDDRPRFDDQLLRGLDRTSSRPFTASTWLTGAIVARTDYFAGDGSSLQLTVGLRALQGGAGPADLLLDDLSVVELSAANVPIGSVTTGALLDEPGVRLVQWIDEDGQIVTLTAQRSIAELLELVPRVRRATADEWVTLRDSQFRPIRPRGSIVLGSGTTSQAVTWQAGVQTVEVPGDPAWRWWWLAPAGDGASWTWLPMGPDTQPRALTVVYPGLVYVLVSLPEGSADQVLVRGDGFERTVTATPLAGTERRLAVTAVATDQPLELALVDADGTPTPITPEP